MLAPTQRSRQRPESINDGLVESPQTKWQIVPFDKAAHDRTGFDCGNAALNEWLHKRVGQFEKRDLSRTYVLVQGNNPAVRGFYAISSHCVTYGALPEDQAKGLPQIDVPVVLLGKLAVDATAKGQRLGELLLMDALRRADSLSRQIDIRAVQVDAIDESARQFYLKYGFTALTDDTNHLFLPISIIRRLDLSG